MKPICFMVMPYGVKETEAKAPAPSKVDFDALWHQALCPLIKELGYEPVRADQDLGSLIIHEMMERLYFSDLVVADVSIPNGNVYYEIGIRHAAKQTGCVLIGAEWSKPLFDIDQMRQIRYPLPAQKVSEEVVKRIRIQLLEKIPQMATAEGPVHQVLPGYPDADKIEPQRASTILKSLKNFASLQAQAKVLLSFDQETRRDRVKELKEEYAPSGKPIKPSIAIELVILMRDCSMWEDALSLIDELPDDIQNSSFIQEQKALIQSKSGDHLEAIIGLQTLIQLSGDSSERQGLLGGRYKKLFRETNDPKHLDSAIKHYENGMKLDLNDYYPTCNLPVLYSERNAEGDKHKSEDAVRLTYLACERAIQLNLDDEWLRPTLLGLAFQEGDVEKARELVELIKLDNVIYWKIETSLDGLESSANKTEGETKSDLTNLIQELKNLLHE